MPFGASVSPVAVPRELRHRAHVACDELGAGNLLLAAQQEQPVQALVGARPRVHEVIVGMDRAAEHLEQRDLPDVGIGDRLEDQRERVGLLVGGDVELLIAGVHLHRTVER